MLLAKSVKYEYIPRIAVY